jgi:hypothetical protein
LPELSEIPALFQDDIIEQGFELAALANMNPKERTQYEQSLKELRDFINVIDTAKREGRAEEREAVSRSLLKQGVSIDIIANGTELSPEAIHALQP